MAFIIELRSWLRFVLMPGRALGPASMRWRENCLMDGGTDQSAPAIPLSRPRQRGASERGGGGSQSARFAVNAGACAAFLGKLQAMAPVWPPRRIAGFAIAAGRGKGEGADIFGLSATGPDRAGHLGSTVALIRLPLDRIGRRLFSRATEFRQGAEAPKFCRPLFLRIFGRKAGIRFC
ncbi:hypothetical protein PE067_18720 [Paracoccus sp. DMF-8]|uniref:hypothetical protein n=1 Tax=Paracoccus sp. DMF-8 TaxID=3019445 RepID=UPI0023E3DAF8|nr:hypothetical protein [Paracoccus sp. DMF-8]MDF3607981.1 hypothetical protein [Paracoccus sp. DMF-8]